jgi:hypothetical protein
MICAGLELSQTHQTLSVGCFTFVERLNASSQKLKAAHHWAAPERGKREGNLREGDARRRSATAKRSFGQVENFGRVMQTSMASFIAYLICTSKTKKDDEFLWKL